MLPAILEALHGIQRSFSGSQYVSDHPECFEILRSKVEHLGVKGRIIFDHNQFFNCSCTRQPARVRSLLQAGGEVRVYRPENGRFACMHAKMWVLDAEVVLTGSPNTTENGLSRSKEHLWLVRLPHCASFVVNDFEQIWPASRAVTLEDTYRAEERSQERRSRRSRSLSRAHSASINRELIPELDGD